MTVASGEINHDLTCHVAKVKAATSAHSMADVIPIFSVLNIPFEANASTKPKKISFRHNKENNIRNIVRVLMFQQLLANKHHTLRDSKFGREKVWLCSPTKPCAEREPHSAHGRAVKIKINPVQSGAAEQEPRSAHGRAVKEYI